jgi:hypothetical protein
MAFIPYERLTIRTPYTPEAAWWKLATVVEPGPIWLFRKSCSHRPPKEETRHDSTFKSVRLLAAPISPVSILFSTNHLPYLGTLDGYKFEIRRIIHYRNSFLPIIKGEIRPDAGGSSIEITMHPHLVAIVLLIGLLAGAGLIFSIIIFGVIYSALQSHGLSTISLTGLLQGCMYPIGFLLFVYLLVTLPFKYESHKSIAFFRELFEA